MTTPIIEVTSLQKRIGKKQILDIGSWTVSPGDICGLLGPNGAGKTTTLKILMGLTRRDAGGVSVLGREPRGNLDLRSTVAFLPEDRVAYANLRGSEFVRFYSRHFHSWDAAFFGKLAAAWNIDLNEKIGAFSKGTRTKLMIAVVFARKPSLLLLDEPTSDLDPESVEEVLKLLTTWVSEGDRAAVVATHRLDEVDRICNRVSILHDGRILLNEDLEDLRLHWRVVRCLGTEAVERLAAMESDDRVVSLVMTGRAATAVFRKDGEAVVESLKSGLKSGDAVAETVDLRRVYLAVTGYERGRLDGALEALA